MGTPACFYDIWSLSMFMYCAMCVQLHRGCNKHFPHQIDTAFEEFVCVHAFYQHETVAIEITRHFSSHSSIDRIWMRMRSLLSSQSFNPETIWSRFDRLKTLPLEEVARKLLWCDMPEDIFMWPQSSFKWSDHVIRCSNRAVQKLSLDGHLVKDSVTLFGDETQSSSSDVLDPGSLKSSKSDDSPKMMMTQRLHTNRNVEYSGDDSKPTKENKFH